MSSSAELAMLVLGVGVLVGGVRRRGDLQRLEHWGLLALSFGSLLLGWVATTLESVLAAPIFNSIEHTGYALGAVLAAVWCWKLPALRGES